MPRLSSSRTSVACVNRFWSPGTLRRDGDVADSELDPLLKRGNGRVLAIGRPRGFEPREQDGDPSESETPRTRLRLHAAGADPGRGHLALQRAAAGSARRGGPRRRRARARPWDQTTSAGSPRGPPAAPPPALKRFGGSATYSPPCAAATWDRSPRSASADSATASVRM